VFAAAAAAFLLLDGQEYLSFEALKSARDLLRGYAERHYGAALALSLLAFTAATALSLPVATVLSLAIGLMFGRWLGTAVIVLAGTLGATLLLVAARYVFRDWIERHAGGYLERFDRAFQRSAFLYLAFLRTVPVLPFWLVNLAAAGTRIPAATYAAATAAGMVPISFVWASLGESLGRIQSLEEALSGTTLIALTVLGLAGVGAIYAKNRLFGASDPSEHR
jgi:uncharacterized membrane protein YdjX (TVP38/TMEM64 family)